MKLSVDSWFLKWTYMLNPKEYQGAGYYSRIPERTSVCALFWRGVVFMPAILFLALSFIWWALQLGIENYDVVAMVFFLLFFGGSLAGSLLALLVTTLQQNPPPVLLKAGAAVGEGVAAVGEGVTVTFDYLAARKEKMCPVVTIEHKGGWNYEGHA